MSFRCEAVEKGMRTRRATEGSAGVLEQYVEEPDRAQRSPRARIDSRSRKFMNFPGWLQLVTEPRPAGSGEKIQGVSPPLADARGSVMKFS